MAQGGLRAAARRIVTSDGGRRRCAHRRDEAGCDPRVDMTNLRFVQQLTIGRAQARRKDQRRPGRGIAQSSGNAPAFTHLRKDEYGQSAARKACPCFTGL